MPIPLGQSPGLLKAERLLNEAVQCWKKGQGAEALRLCFRAYELAPSSYPVLSALGALLLEQDQPARAIQVLQRALEIRPTEYDLLYNTGIALLRLAKLEEALHWLQRALEQKPAAHQALYEKGRVLRELGRLPEALNSFQQALDAGHSSPELYGSIGETLIWLCKPQEARAHIEKALALNPKDANAYVNLGFISKDAGDLEQALAYFRKALEIQPDHSFAHSNLAYVLNYTSTSKDELFREHKVWGETHAPLPRSEATPSNTKDPEGRLRVGYVSPDFRDHSVAFFLEPLVSGHDKDKLELFAYANLQKRDATTERLKLCFNCWREVRGMSATAVAELIRKDGIDILVDLAGHSLGHRLDVFALKPAPLQVTYLGYPNTTGIPAIDYRFTDAWADPAGEEDFHTEKLVRLPEGFLCYTPPTNAPAAGAPPAVRNGHITFGSFNLACKISEGTVRAWSQILKRVPNSRLMLKSHVFDKPETRKKCSALFESCGVGGDQLQICCFEPLRATHLSLYGELDVGLDPFPYNGTTTTCEALWMGVPVIVLAGNRHASRVGVSLLHQIKATELIANSTEDYVERAVALAFNLKRLQEYRSNLRAQVSGSPLCDKAAFAGVVESAYRQMWRAWCAGNRPQAFQVLPQTRNSSPTTIVPSVVQAPAPEPAAQPVSGQASLKKGLGIYVLSHVESRGRAAELAILADVLYRCGRRIEAGKHAESGLTYLERGHFDRGVPQALLDEWQAPSLRALLLRQCLCLCCFSSLFEPSLCQKWLMEWAETEPENAEPFLRFGLLHAALAKSSGAALPPAATDALRHAFNLRPDARTQLTLDLVLRGLNQLVVPYDGMALHVQPDLTAISTFVLLEQGDWYADEIDFLRRIVRPGDRFLDLGATVGVYGFSAAQRVGAEGKVVLVEPDPAITPLLQQSARPFANVSIIAAAISDSCGEGEYPFDRSPQLSSLRARDVAPSGNRTKVKLLTIDEIARRQGIDAFDIIKLTVGGLGQQALRGAAKIIKEGQPVVIFNAKGSNGLDFDLMHDLKALGYECYCYSAPRKALVRFTATSEYDDLLVNMIALRPETLERIAAVVPIT